VKYENDNNKYWCYMCVAHFKTEEAQSPINPIN